uniref:Uncharacterized protein n=1 Tax=uncultured bacterium F42-01 TaxID=1191438 RepID=I3VII3_9BACT|nr:hypothetical protein [uncultured bacterium F42-01]
MRAEGLRFMSTSHGQGEFAGFWHFENRSNATEPADGSQG